MIHQTFKDSDPLILVILVNLATRALCMLLSIFSIVGCTTTLHIIPDNKILEEEAAQLPAAKPVPVSVSIEINAPVIAVGRKPGRVGEPRDLVLDYHAYQLISDAANVCSKRWFSNVKAMSRQYEISIQTSDLVYDEYTDVLAWQAVIRMNLSVQAKRDSKIYLNKEYSSGNLKGGWKRTATERHITEQYTRLIYRALLITIDKAMAELARAESQK